MKRYWIKLWIDVINDPKMGAMSDYLWRRTVELFLVAGSNGDTDDGLLPSPHDLAWLLRSDEQSITRDLQELTKAGILEELPDGAGCKVKNFKKRQYSENLDRMRQYRARNKESNSDGSSDEDVAEMLSISSSPLILSDSSSDSSSETTSFTKYEDDIFLNAFGEPYGGQVQKRWRALAKAIGRQKANEIAAWAKKKEIHIKTRSGLMDSMETAAKTWGKDKKNPGSKRGKEVEDNVNKFMNREA